MNKITVVGNLGKDAEVRTTSSGKSVCSFSLASSRSFKKGDTWEKETTWFTVSVWGDKASKYGSTLKKGTRVMVEGELRQRKYVDKSGGEKTTYDLVAERVYLVSTPGEQREHEELPMEQDLE